MSNHMIFLYRIWL